MCEWSNRLTGVSQTAKVCNKNGTRDALIYQWGEIRIGSMCAAHEKQYQKVLEQYGIGRAA